MAQGTVYCTRLDNGQVEVSVFEENSSTFAQVIITDDQLLRLLSDIVTVLRLQLRMAVTPEEDGVPF